MLKAQPKAPTMTSTDTTQAPIKLPAVSKLGILPSLAELEVCSSLILEAPLRPTWAEGLAIHRSPSWLQGKEEAAADIDRLDLAEVSFKLPNAPKDRLVRMSYWQFAYIATLSAGGFSLHVDTIDGCTYVLLKAYRPPLHLRDEKPRRYKSTLARLLEDACRGEIVTYADTDRLDLRPHLIKLTGGSGREATTAAVMKDLRARLRARGEPGLRDYMKLLEALKARLKQGSESYRSAHLLAEGMRAGPHASENPSMSP